jgi:hypothetical protein
MLKANKSKTFQTTYYGYKSLMFEAEKSFNKGADYFEGCVDVIENTTVCVAMSSFAWRDFVNAALEHNDYYCNNMLKESTSVHVQNLCFESKKKSKDALRFVFHQKTLINSFIHLFKK